MWWFYWWTGPVAWIIIHGAMLHEAQVSFWGWKVCDIIPSVLITWSGLSPTAEEVMKYVKSPFNRQPLNSGQFAFRLWTWTPVKTEDYQSKNCTSLSTMSLRCVNAPGLCLWRRLNGERNVSSQWTARLTGANHLCHSTPILCGASLV